eukprot:TRINITY_DN53656_c0_g1_i1.p1 TRINITY_DN53656_c0_g1~~TRINITY_DN53656_c0_g1_i1.p1  ORF type:complete len:667 (+),score=131.06 TRINITY_DN53656_c0_g1_i1:89-2002(+)
MAPSANYVSLSPGELERYQREEAKRLRCERLHQVRRREDALARKSAQQYQQRLKQDAQQLQAAEVRMQLESKRARLADLLEKRAAYEASCKTAMLEAESRERAAEAQRAAAAAIEARRREQEAQRALEAFHRSRSSRLTAERAEAECRARRRDVQQTEQSRARKAAELGRSAVAAREAAREAAQEEDEVAKSRGPQRVLKMDPLGLEEYAKTYYHVVHHGPHEATSAGGDEGVQVELGRPLSPPPRPTPQQEKANKERGQAARLKLIAQRQVAEAERRQTKIAEEERQKKVQAVASAGLPRGGSSRWTAELLPWRVQAVSTIAAREIQEILDESCTQMIPASLKSRPQEQTPERHRDQAKARCDDGGHCVASWSVPTLAWPSLPEEQAADSGESDEDGCRPQSMLDEDKAINSESHCDCEDLSRLEGKVPLDVAPWVTVSTPQGERFPAALISQDGENSAEATNTQHSPWISRSTPGPERLSERILQYGRGAAHELEESVSSSGRSSITASSRSMPWDDAKSPHHSKHSVAEAVSEHDQSEVVLATPAPSWADSVPFAAQHIPPRTPAQEEEEDGMEGLLDQAEALLQETAFTAHLQQAIPETSAGNLSRRWAVDDLSKRLDQICRELEDVMDLHER